MTEFTRNLNPALKKLQQGDIILRRTKRQWLHQSQPRVTRSSGADGIGEMARVLALFIETLPLTPPALIDALTTHYRWVRFLPKGDRAEFLETMKACASINNFSRIEAVVNAWRSSAEIHADPQLLAQFTKSLSVAIGPALRRP